MTDETKPTVRFHVTQERMADVPFGELLDIEENPNNTRMVAQFMARFVADDKGNYLTEEDARKAIRAVTLGQIMSAFQRITGDLQEVAVPNG